MNSFEKTKKQIKQENRSFINSDYLVQQHLKLDYQSKGVLIRKCSTLNFLDQVISIFSAGIPFKRLQNDTYL